MIRIAHGVPTTTATSSQAANSQPQALDDRGKQTIEQRQSREAELRRLGLIAKITGAAFSMVGLGFIWAPPVFQAKEPGSSFHDQTTMMGIMFMVLSAPLLLLGQTLHRGRNS